MKHFDGNHHGFRSLDSAHKAMVRIGRHINEVKKQKENRERVEDLQCNTTGWIGKDVRGGRRDGRGGVGERVEKTPLDGCEGEGGRGKGSAACWIGKDVRRRDGGWRWEKEGRMERERVMHLHYNTTCWIGKCVRGGRRELG